MQGCKVIFQGVFTRENAQLWNFLGNLPISFLLHSEKVSIPELVFHSSDRVRKKKKRFNLPLYCLVLAEKKFCKTAYRSRQFPHTFMTFVWILNIYHGKVLASNSEKDIDIQYVTDWRWRHESRTTKTSSSLSFCYRFYPYSVNTKFEINGFWGAFP